MSSINVKYRQRGTKNSFIPVVKAFVLCDFEKLEGTIGKINFSNSVSLDQHIVQIKIHLDY